jgi:hypothetical protein
VDFNTRPGFDIRPPSVARHLVFRLLLKENPRWPTDDPKPTHPKWSDLCDYLADHINDLKGAYHPTAARIALRPPHEKSDEPDCPSLRRSRIFDINRYPLKDGYRLRVRVDLHTELFSVTYIFDRIDPAASNSLSKKIASLNGDPEAINWLFDQLWKTRTLPATKVISSWRGRGRQSGPRPRRFGTLITDFRGVTICPRRFWHMGRPSLVSPPLNKDAKPELNGALREFTRTHMPLLRAVVARKASPAGSDAGGESVVCGMLDGKALYAAELGQWGKDVKQVQPVRHLLVYAGHSHAQLGRLLRRMHVLGELRHAALIDFDQDPLRSRAGGLGRGLRNASVAMRALGQRLSDRTSAITAPGTSMKELQAAVGKLANISKMVDGGLTYRVEQSRYYAREFESAVQHLRLVRFGDWQPYDDFVQRYVLQLFARIDRIGNRYEALGRRVDRLLFYKQADRLDTYTADVRATLTTINKATELLNRSAVRQIDVSRNQLNLLKTAEVFAAVFLIYYVGSVLHYLFELEGVKHSGVKEPFLWGWSGLIALLGVPLFVVIMWRVLPHVWRECLLWTRRLWRRLRRRGPLEKREEQAMGGEPGATGKAVPAAAVASAARKSRGKAASGRLRTPGGEQP